MDNKIQMDMAQVLELLSKAAKLEAVETLVRTTPNYSLSEVLRAFFPAPQDKVEG